MKGEPNIPLVRLWERCTIEKFGDGFRPVPGCRVRPANCVSWYGAVAYCRWLSGVTGEMHRLPTEAEWEYAARGPEGRLFPWGGTELQTSYANVPGHWMVTVQRTLRKVGDSPKDCTPNGIYDLVGNVREWCSDWYGNPPIYGGTNPQGLSFGYWKTLRGHGYQNSDGWKALHLTDLPGLRGTCLHVALLWVTSGQGLSRDDLGTGVATC
jgi:formylglycine-generating enzyme required for sulfatase activity